ncbi:MAG: hypothetical protein JWO05_1164 [Gemmatimonadetes bacterium]|nr:hypothetical protein [Gemmatimonadota bacterium]
MIASTSSERRERMIGLLLSLLAILLVLIGCQGSNRTGAKASDCAGGRRPASFDRLFEDTRACAQRFARKPLTISIDSAIHSYHIVSPDSLVAELVHDGTTRDDAINRAGFFRWATRELWLTPYGLEHRDYTAHEFVHAFQLEDPDGLSPRDSAGVRQVHYPPLFQACAR